MDWGTAFGSLPTAVTEVITDIAPLGITVLVALAGVNIALSLFSKFGVRGA